MLDVWLLPWLLPLLLDTVIVVELSLLSNVGAVLLLLSLRPPELLPEDGLFPLSIAVLLLDDEEEVVPLEGLFPGEDDKVVPLTEKLFSILVVTLGPVSVSIVRSLLELSPLKLSLSMIVGELSLLFIMSYL